MGLARFEQLITWQRAHSLAVAVYRATAEGQFARDPALRDQVRRAAVSVASNIAEGFERYGRAEFRHFLSIARGSAGEVRSQMMLARDLGYVDTAALEQIEQLCLEISRLIAALRRAQR